MFCIKCGKEIGEKDSFCPLCGAQQQTAPPAVSADAITDGWHYIDSRENRVGPFSYGAVMGFIKAGNISRETLVWKKGMSEWLPAGQTELFHALKNAVPSLPPEAISDRWAWALATDWFFISIVLNIVGLRNFDDTWFIYSIANTIFFLRDRATLKKSGFKMSRWIWWGISLYPVYLFIRAKKIGKRYGYAITWCVLFVLSLWLGL